MFCKNKNVIKVGITHQGPPHLRSTRLPAPSKLPGLPQAAPTLRSTLSLLLHCILSRHTRTLVLVALFADLARGMRYFISLVVSKYVV